MPKDLIVVARSTKYSVDAFVFLQRGLDYAVRKAHGEPTPDADPASRHVSGQFLCAALRDYAIEQYGLLARSVLRRWGIQSCEDFGRIVFAMVEGGLLQKTDNDSIRDFMGVYDFAHAFSTPLSLGEKA